MLQYTMWYHTDFVKMTILNTTAYNFYFLIYLIVLLISQIGIILQNQIYQKIVLKLQFIYFILIIFKKDYYAIHFLIFTFVQIFEIQVFLMIQIKIQLYPIIFELTYHIQLCSLNSVQEQFIALVQDYFQNIYDKII